MGRPRPRSPALILDAGALIAYERGDQEVVTLLEGSEREGVSVTIPAGVLAQAWRDGARQARLARLVGAEDVMVVPLDEPVAKAVGSLCASTGTSDLVDASVVIAAQATGGLVLTSDPGDLRRLDPSLPLERV
ncbi:MAG: PIN domain-containing protein [Solirubrobacteraceae bacterium MAG38_C4-C5]|nr:PIN domain-containing protein [Candidatus Siliceabacter maunaloa]